MDSDIGKDRGKFVCLESLFIGRKRGRSQPTEIGKFIKN